MSNLVLMTECCFLLSLGLVLSMVASEGCFMSLITEDKVEVDVADKVPNVGATVSADASFILCN
jgi:hypothetical protein